MIRKEVRMERRPTKKQKELLSFIDGFIKGNGYGPSYREIMRALDYKSVSTVATHVNGLISRGWLAKKDNSARTLEVVGAINEPSHLHSETKQSDTEREIMQKIDELRGQDNDACAADISALERTLELLGYRTADKKVIG